MKNYIIHFSEGGETQLMECNYFAISGNDLAVYTAGTPRLVALDRIARIAFENKDEQASRPIETNQRKLEPEL
jgi:hypothetical protein